MTDKIFGTGKIKTYLGAYVNPLAPDKTQIHLADIVHSLSLTCRWTGHCKRHYSVLLHSLVVAWKLWRGRQPGHLIKWGLLHEGGEAYMGDLAKPVKSNIQQYEKTEHRLMLFIASLLQLWPVTDMPATVKQADYDVLLMEANSDILFDSPREPENYGAVCWPPWTLEEALREIFLPRLIRDKVPLSWLLLYLSFPSVVRSKFEQVYNTLEF